MTCGGRRDNLGFQCVSSPQECVAEQKLDQLIRSKSCKNVMKSGCAQWKVTMLVIGDNCDKEDRYMVVSIDLAILSVLNQTSKDRFL